MNSSDDTFDPNRMMTPEEIAALIAAQEESAMQENSGESTEEPSEDDLDVAELIAGMEDADDDLKDIAELLKKSDQNEMVEDFTQESVDEDFGFSEEADFVLGEDEPNEAILDSDFVDSVEKKETGASNPPISDNENADEETSDGKKKKKFWKKKGSFLGKLFNALTEEEEEETAVPEKNATLLSEENLSILNEIDAEEENRKGKKDKKKKKEKPPKEKKEKKPKKPKKEKKPKGKSQKAGEADNAKKIPKKHIVRTFALSLSILAALLVLAAYLPGMRVMENGRNAYYHGDYREAFLCLYGKELSPSDQLIYDSAKTIVLLERKYESYENHRSMQMDYEALDALFQGVVKYEELLPEAERLSIVPELDDVRRLIEEVLWNEYHISWEEAVEIVDYNPLDYTNKLYSIIDGNPFVFISDEINAMYGFSSNKENGSVSEENVTMEPVLMEGITGENNADRMEDLLPEEEEYLNQQNDSNGLNDGGTNGGGTNSNGNSNVQTPIQIEVESSVFG